MINRLGVKLSSIPMQKTAFIMSEEGDNVAVAKREIKKNTLVDYRGRVIKIKDNIPKGHRFSLFNIRKNELVSQYGYPFGLSMGIKEGRLINKYNVAVHGANYKDLLRLAPKNNRPIEKYGKISTSQSFMGYKRADGQIGTRNYYLIVPTSLCASDVAVKIAQSIDGGEKFSRRYRNLDGVVAAAHTEGCGCNDGEIIERLMLVLKNTIAHPNVGGALVVDLGCEKTNYKAVSRYFGCPEQFKKPIDYISIQKSGGTHRSFERGRNIVLRRIKKVNSICRQAVSIKHLIAGTECGASDSFSGITANPLIGSVVDRIIRCGGAAILSETTEMVGAEASLIKRMATRGVAKKFINGMKYYKNLANKLGVSLEGNFVPGNEKGGLVNLTLKSLGAILKGGSTEIMDFIDYSERIKAQGLSIMNGPGNDLESMTGIVASGANVILFSTGMGATEGNLIVPVIKISTRTELYKKLKEDIDFDAGSLLKGNASLKELSDKLLDLVIKVSSGEKTWAEIWKKRSFQIWTAGKLSL